MKEGQCSRRNGPGKGGVKGRGDNDDKGARQPLVTLCMYEFI